MTVELGIAIPSTMVTGDTVNTHAIALSDEIKGGWHSVADTTARDAIPAPRLQVGMGVWVGTAAAGKLYVWSGSAWVEFVQGGGSPAYQNLAQEYETPASVYTAWTMMVATTNNGVVCFGGATGGKFGKFDWTTFTWTEGVCTGATVAAYTWAIYVPSVDLIWAGTSAGAATHTINPSTMVATDISGSSGVIGNAVYNPVSGFVYGYVASSSTIKEMNATTGVVARSFNYTTASSGYHSIGVHTVSGALYLIQKNTGSGPFWLEVPYSAFNAVSHSVSCLNAPTLVNNQRIAVDPVNGRCVWWGASTIGVAYAIGSATSVDIVGRLASGGGQICYNTTNGYFYCIYLASLLFAARVDGSTVFLASKFVTGLASGLTVSQMKHIIYDSVTDRIYVLTNAGSMIRLIP